MITVRELLTRKEIKKFNGLIDLDKEARFLTWLELSNMAYDLMITEGINKGNGKSLSSFSLDILSLRAIKLKKAIFE